jgi:hypothetical protein
VTTADDQLLHETRMRPRAAVAAAVAGVALVVAAVLELVGPHAAVNELTLGLINEHRRFKLDIASNVVGAIGWGGVAITLNFLYRAARTRNEQLNPFFGVIAIVGAAAIAISGVALAIASAIWAHDFVGHGAQTYDQAKSLTGGALLPILSYAGLLGLLMTAVGYVLISLNAMRVGLLTRFMGYLGIFAGILTIAAITPVPVVAGYWLIALAVLFLGRWPTGTPPAWRSGRAEAWPSSQQMREQARERNLARRGGGAKPAPKAAQPVAANTGGSSRATTAKRKRKKRK